ncbi:hypothetical protein MUK42_17440 [Musa troglodytarum]|uniref:Uncharacterized protein n=1 Tax=Musa troglodytarum TaxID=320322 RepID=A0A9E7H6N5_9LILI|nr:hypothetical protein MUK42_17440 [Musa troglodytarum]
MGVERQAFLRWELEKGRVMFLWFGVELRKPGWFSFLEGWGEYELLGEEERRGERDVHYQMHSVLDVQKNE